MGPRRNGGKLCALLGGGSLFKKLVLTVLLCGTFLVGYDLGRKPGSPDIVGGAWAAGERAVEIGRGVYEAVNDAAGDTPAEPPDEHGPQAAAGPSARSR